ncbi:autoinducer binding domain-containing protein [Yoonia vestfoldensis]|uniref:autoinducer binding domain-containing protein n=1 Tax=Yoonia vestfoldensis TaxID=245188 RepID=UPI000369AA44|nr:autoinducer binding domain-containing protein [Yoonia vestfoldensis]
MKSDDIYHLIASGADPETCWTATSEYLKAHGFDKIIYLRLDPQGLAPTIRTTMPKAFQQFYDKNGYQQDDPFLVYCLKSR